MAERQAAGGMAYRPEIARKKGVSKYWDRSHLNLEAVLSTYPLYRGVLRKMLAPMGR
jgi:hypothetical protein